MSEGEKKVRAAEAVDDPVAIPLAPAGLPDEVSGQPSPAAVAVAEPAMPPQGGDRLPASKKAHKPKRRHFSAAEKLRVVREADACSERGEIEALLRREGIYSSHLSAWRRALRLYGEHGVAARAPGRPKTRDSKDEEIAKLEREIATLRRDIERMQTVIEVPKILHAAGADDRGRRTMNLEVLENERGALPVAELCDALGVPRATYYRAQQPPTQRVPASVARRVPRKLSDADRAAIWAALHEERFVDQPPAEIVATLLSEGVYLASERTYYRLLAESIEVRERRAQRRHPPPHMPSLVARGPNEVWTWDITKLAGPAKGVFYYAYVMIDLFSRFIVGWLVAPREPGALAAQWLKGIITARAVDATRLKVHNDRGAPMTSQPFTQLLAQLGITPSLLHAEGYFEEFVAWHNEVHHHAGLALFTPGEVYRGEVEAVAQRRQDALDRAYQAHPERFVRGPRVCGVPHRR